VAEAAPWPVFGFFHETPFDWVAVDVLQLFYVLCVGEDVEVVVGGCPRSLALS